MMNKNAYLVLAATGLLMAPAAFAQNSSTTSVNTNSSTVKMEDLKKS
nr:hypothetical protein HAGR004_31640 [Bdellovibrio sp. HAGR004]